MKNRYVLLDRDGTLIEHIHHLSSRELVKIYDDTFEGLRKIASLGFRFGIITNQSIVNRGLATLEQVDDINQHIASTLKEMGISIDFILVCPHVPEDLCDCRKPNPALGRLAIEKFKIDPTKSFMVGDQASDVEFGIRLGVTPIGIRNQELKSVCPTLFFHNFNVFSEWLANNRGQI